MIKAIHPPRYIQFFIALLILGYLGGCNSDDDSEETDPGGLLNSTPFQFTYENFPNPTGLEPDNPLTESGVMLGRMLFYDKQLSKNNIISCSSCHRQEHAFTDTAQFSSGDHGQLGTRQAMTIFNNAWHTNRFFWDGRADLLREQALMPIQDSLEMNETLENVIEKLSNSDRYRKQFAKAFGSFEITADKIGLALEQFMMSIESTQSKYDRYLLGEIALSDSEERGREIFFRNANPNSDNPGGSCFRCHTGPNFENDAYMNNGLDSDETFTDLGREQVTEYPSDRGKFKVMSMRNIALSAPYMHDGRFATLEEVVEFYNSGMQSSSTLDFTLIGLQQSGMGLEEQDVADLVNFLHTLTDENLPTDPRYSNPF